MLSSVSEKSLNEMLCTRLSKQGIWTMIAIWPFWNCLLEIKSFGHFAIFWPFLKFDWNSTFQRLFQKNLSKTYNLLWNSNFESSCFNIFFWKYGLYLAFLKLLMDKFGLFSNLATLIWNDNVSNTCFSWTKIRSSNIKQRGSSEVDGIKILHADPKSA